MPTNGSNATEYNVYRPLDLCWHFNKFGWSNSPRRQNGNLLLDPRSPPAAVLQQTIGPHSDSPFNYACRPPRPFTPPPPPPSSSSLSLLVVRLISIWKLLPYSPPQRHLHALWDDAFQFCTRRNVEYFTHVTHNRQGYFAAGWMVGAKELSVFTSFRIWFSIPTPIELPLLSFHFRGFAYFICDDTTTCSLGLGQEMVDEMSAGGLGLDGVNCFWRFPLIFVSQS